LVDGGPHALLKLQPFRGHVRPFAIIDQLGSDCIYRDHAGSLWTIGAIGGEAHTPHDREEPGARIVIMERWEVPDGAEDCFLHCVLRIGLVPGEIHRESEAG
jgi:hypothetical protein